MDMQVEDQVRRLTRKLSLEHRHNYQPVNPPTVENFFLCRPTIESGPTHNTDHASAAHIHRPDTRVLYNRVQHSNASVETLLRECIRDTVISAYQTHVEPAMYKNYLQSYLPTTDASRQSSQLLYTAILLYDD